MNLYIILFATLILAIVQISIFKSLGNLGRWLAAIPIFAILLNFGASSVILIFTGVASLVGLANLASSILFGIYVFLYKHVHGISIEMEHKRLISIPVLVVKKVRLRGIMGVLF